MPLYFHFRNNPEHISWDSQLKTERCEFVKPDGHRCKRNVIIGLSYCFQHRLKKYHVQSKPSTIPNAGIGLFANNGTNNNDIVFKKNQKIVPYNGQITTKRVIDERYGDATAPYALEIRGDRVTDGALMRGIGTLLNHKSRTQSNARFSVAKDNNEVNLVATKDIRNRNELFVNYGNDYRFHEAGVNYSTNNSKYRL